MSGSCNICCHPIRTRFHFEESHTMCTVCGATTIFYDLVAIFVGSEGDEHILNVNRPEKCSTCGSRIMQLIQPCGGSYYFMSTVDKELENRK